MENSHTLTMEIYFMLDVDGMYHVYCRCGWEVHTGHAVRAYQARRVHIQWHQITLP